MKSDLHVISCLNVIIKFADDTTLLVPENTDLDLDLEFRHVTEWAASNRLTLNTGKTKEIVFGRPQVKYFICHLLLIVLSRLTVVNCLVCFFQSSLKMDSQSCAIYSVTVRTKNVYSQIMT